MVLQGGPCGRVDRRRTQFNNEPHLLIQVGLIFWHFFTEIQWKQMIFRYLISMDEIVDLEQLRVKINKLNELDLSQHSAEFELLHKQLQQVLTNLDGV